LEIFEKIKKIKAKGSCNKGESRSEKQMKHYLYAMSSTSLSPFA